MSEKEEVKKGQMPDVVTPDMLLAQIVTHIGEEFVVIRMDGWAAIVGTIKDSSDEGLLQTMDDLKIPVIPISLKGKPPEDESLIIKPNDTQDSGIIMPNDVPQGDSKIIMP